MIDLSKRMSRGESNDYRDYAGLLVSIQSIHSVSFGKARSKHLLATTGITGMNSGAFSISIAKVRGGFLR
jgi:hypothetical protein